MTSSLSVAAARIPVSILSDAAPEPWVRLVYRKFRTMSSDGVLSGSNFLGMMWEQDGLTQQYLTVPTERLYEFYHSFDWLDEEHPDWQELLIVIDITGNVSATLTVTDGEPLPSGEMLDAFRNDPLDRYCDRHRDELTEIAVARYGSRDKGTGLFGALRRVLGP